MIELEFSVFSRQCLKRSIPSVEELNQEITTWEETRNRQQATVDWQFSAVDARVKLERLYHTQSLS